MVSSTNDLTKSFNFKAPRPLGVHDVDKKGRYIKTHEDYLVGERMVNGTLTKLRAGLVIESDVDGADKKRQQEQKRVRVAMKSREDLNSEERKTVIDRRAKEFKALCSEIRKLYGLHPDWVGAVFLLASNRLEFPDHPLLLIRCST